MPPKIPAPHISIAPVGWRPGATPYPASAGLCGGGISKRSVRASGRGITPANQALSPCRRAAMSLQTLGYIGLRTNNLEDWTAYAERFLRSEERRVGKE